MPLKPIQIGRKLEVSEEFLIWVDSLNLIGLSLVGSFHVTVIYSSSAVDWSQKTFAPLADPLKIEGGRRSIELFDNGTLTLTFESSDLIERWSALFDAGASWDYSDYRPHITLAHLPAQPPLGLTAYKGTLNFGPEYRKHAKSLPT